MSTTEYKIRLKGHASLVVMCFAVAMLCTITNTTSFSQARIVPFSVLPSLFDSSRSDDLGLSVPAGIETITIFRPTENTPKYCLGVVLIAFKRSLYAQWQTSAKDEDSRDTWVAFSRSKDGFKWTTPIALIPQYAKETMHTSGGWWTDGETLIAYINVWITDSTQPRGGHTEYIVSKDGIHWTEPKSLCDHFGKSIQGIIEQDLHALPSGRIITAFHEQPGLIVTPYYTDDFKGISGWKKGIMQNLPYKGTISRELEPSWFYKPNGTIVMVFRDQNHTFRQLASASSDSGQTWTAPMITNMLDSRAKQSAGNLSNGTAFMVNCPSGNKSRFPLVMTLSKNGEVFDKAFVLRKAGADLQPLHYKGKNKSTGYNYPKSFVWNGYIYISYATNKEDVEITRIPLSSLEY
jgi:hypothetical protein